MKNTSLITKSRAYVIFFMTGWKSIEVFGPPKEIMGAYLVTLKNQAVMEYNYSNYGGKHNWWKIGIGNESNDNPVIFWKELPKPPYVIK